MGFTANNLKGLGSVFGSPYGSLVSPGGSLVSLGDALLDGTAFGCSARWSAREVFDARFMQRSMIGSQRTRRNLVSNTNPEPQLYRI